MNIAIHTPQQLAKSLKGQRKSRGMTQKDTALLVGLLPKTISGLETKPGPCKLDSFFKLLSALDLEMTLRDKAKPDLPDGRQNKTDW